MGILLSDEDIKNLPVAHRIKAVLTPDVVSIIKAEFIKGEKTEKEVAECHGVTQSCAHLIKWGYFHKEVEPLTRQQQWVEIRKECPVDELYLQVLGFEAGQPHDENSCLVGVVMLSALIIGADIDAIKYHTGYERKFIQRIYDNLTKCGVWKNGQTINPEWYPEDGQNMTFEHCFSFWLYVLVGLGEIVMLRADENGNPAFALNSTSPSPPA